MRIPYKINKNTRQVYDSSPESLDLIGERQRRLQSGDFSWDKNLPPYLTTLCVEAIKANFINEPLLDELVCKDRDHLLEILDVDLPLNFVIPLIYDEVYWERRYSSNFGTKIFRKPKERTWKSSYLERHVQDMLEHANPEHNDEENMADILALCTPYVKTLTVTELLCWKPPLHWDPEDIPEFYPTDHINFDPVFQQLIDIEELDIIYEMKNVTDSFNWNMFKLSLNDCQRLGKAIYFHLRSIRILRLHRSKLEDPHVRLLIQNLIKNKTIEELDLSHCHISNGGALCIAKMICVHPKLQILNLSNNRIGGLGCEGLGFALLEPDCALKKLNLKLNPLYESGAMGLMRALVRGTNLQELSMAACQFNGDASIRTGQMLLLNTSLKKLDVSNNWFDEEGGQALIEGLSSNRTLEWLDVRETDISQQQQYQIKKYLMRNRLGVNDVEPSDDLSCDIEDQTQTQSDKISIAETLQTTTFDVDD